MKSEEVMQSGASCASVSGSGCALRKWAIEPGEAWSAMLENAVDFGTGGGCGCFCGGSGRGGSMIIETS